MTRIFRILLPLILAFAASAASAKSGTHFYMVMFGAEGMVNQPTTSHTFATFVREDNDVLTQELTISWMPAIGYFSANNSMPLLRIVPGRNYTLDETVSLATNRRVGFWGPYEVSPQLYAAAQNRVAYLSSGATSYKMMILVSHHLRDNPLRNLPGGAVNCIMALSDIAGYLDTGSSWGLGASSQVLSFFSPYLLDNIMSPNAAHADIAQKMNLLPRLGR